MQGNGTIESPYLVATAQDLNAVRNNTSAYYRQVANIDLSNWGNWTPIGTQSDPFGGIYDGVNSRYHYDGGGYYVKGLQVNQTSDYAGLFGYVGYAGGIQNLSCLGVSVRAMSGYGSGFAGAITGFTLAPIRNCRSTGTVQSDYNAGGIAGLSTELIDCCYSEVTVSTSWDRAGGIVGDGEEVSRCCSAGTISGRDMIGGIAGRCDPFPSAITNCYSTGNVSGASGVGGIAGFLGTGEISHCYFAGSLTGESNVGGLIGERQSFSGTYPNGFLYQSLSLGQGITRRAGNNEDFGRSVGKSNSYSGNPITSYAQDNMKFNGIINGFPNFNPILAGKDGQSISLAQAKMLSTYINAGWDMENIWGLDEGLSYPYLRWQRQGGIFVKQGGTVYNISRLVAKVNGELQQCKTYVKQGGQIYQIQ